MTQKICASCFGRGSTCIGQIMFWKFYQKCSTCDGTGFSDREVWKLVDGHFISVLPPTTPALASEDDVPQLEVQSRVLIYEINGKDVGVADRQAISVSAHWNYRDRVVLEIGGQKYTVLADHLKRACDNATNQPVV